MIGERLPRVRTKTKVENFARSIPTQKVPNSDL